nr:M23 family metallopeptidase [uncultured Flavobacterium sp.]
MAGRKVIVVTAVVALTILLVSVLANKAFASVTKKKMQIRGTDNYGSGAFSASRDGGTRSHNGIDLVTQTGDPIYSPISGTVIRIAIPYANDSRYKGLLIEGGGYSVKLFYIVPTIAIGSTVKAGQQVGIAQDLTVKYPGITNHVHLEVYHNGELINPETLY